MRRIAGLLIGLMLWAGGLGAQQTKDSTVCKACRDSVVSQTSTADTLLDSVRVWIPRNTYRTASRTVVVRVDSIVKVPVVTPPPPPPDSGKDSTVTPPSSGVVPLFASDWGNATPSAVKATNDTALLDGKKWVRWGGRGSLSVVSAAGLDFPSTMRNVLRVQHYQQDFDWVEANNKWAPPAIGSSIAFRVYIRNTVSDAVDAGTAYASTHPIESEGGPNGVSGQFYAIHYGSYSDGTYPFFFGVDRASYPLNGWTPGANASTHGGRNYDPATLRKNVTYRIEWKFTRRLTSAYDLEMRISGSDGTVLFDKNSIYAWGGNRTQTMAGSAKSLPIDAGHMSDLRIGINGGFATPSPQFVYWGGFAVCTDWCGAY